MPSLSGSTYSYSQDTGCIFPALEANCCTHADGARGSGKFGRYPLTKLKPAVSGKLEGEKRDHDEAKPENLAMVRGQ